MLIDRVKYGGVMKKFGVTWMAIAAGAFAVMMAAPALRADTLKELSVMTIDKHDRHTIAEGLGNLKGVVDFFNDENHNRVHIMYDPALLLPYQVKEKLAELKVEARLEGDREFAGITETVFAIDRIDYMSEKNISSLLANTPGIVDIFVNPDAGTISLLYLDNVQDEANLSIALAMNGIGNDYKPARHELKFKPEKKIVGGV